MRAFVRIATGLHAVSRAGVSPRRPNSRAGDSPALLAGVHGLIRNRITPAVMILIALAWGAGIVTASSNAGGDSAEGDIGPQSVTWLCPQPIDARAFALLKPTAYLISVTRGGVVDEAALIGALQERQIAGAGLDVFEREPLPEDSPLWTLDNVILTPHAAGRSQNRPRPTIELFCDNLRRYLAGEPLRNVVDKQLGF